MAIVFCLISISGRTQSYSFLNYSVAQGLPQSQVSSLAEDDMGFLWIGTYGGLSKFNGSSFVNYSTNDGILNNRITSLNFFNKQLWIGHEGGVSLRVNNTFRKWIFNKENSNISVSCIVPFMNQIIIATNGAGIYIINQNNTLKNTELKSPDQNRIRGMLSLDNTLYIATRNGLYQTSDLLNFDPVKGTENLNISGIYADKDKIAVLTFEKEIYYYYPNTKKITRYLSDIDVFGLRNLIIDKSDNLWIPSKEGIVFINKKKKITYLNEEKGLPLNTISTIFEDKNGTIWIGSEGKGLFRFPGDKFIYFDTRSGIESDLIISGLEISANNYVFGTYDKGIVHYQYNTFKNYPLNNTAIWAITKGYYDDFWVGSESGILHLSKDLKMIKSYNHSEGTASEKVTCFHRFKNGIIYAGGSNGIYKIHETSIEFIRESSPPRSIGAIRNICEYDNKLLCATDAGLFYYSQNKYTQFLSFRIKVSSLFVDAFNNLWIGTEEGLFWSDGNTIKPVNLSKQTSSNFINFINAYNGYIFVGTNNGLYIIKNKKDKAEITINHYGLEEGLINLESNINSSFIDRNLKLWFGTAQGLCNFNIQSLSTSKEKYPPHLSIKSIKLNFEDFNYKDYTSSFNEEGIPLSLTLPRNKNNVILELDGVDLNKSNDLQFQYYLEDLEENWSPAFSNPLLTLSNIPSGKYTLYVRAINKDKMTSNIYQLKLNITPAFYKTWWFFMIILILAVLIVIAIIQFRINRERMHNYQETLEYKARLSTLEQQSLNASMNRHFIFNALNSIQYFINTQDRISANRYLTNFAKLIRKNLDSSTEENNTVSLMEELERLQLYLSLEAMRFRDRFDYTIETNNIDTENIMVPAMLLQPFIENSIIHGILPVEDRKGHIKIIIEQEYDYIKIILEDNGVGIDNSLKSKSGIKGDHRSQGMEITSKRIDLLKKISHRNFELEGPYQITSENRLINGTRVLIKIPCENLEIEN